MSEMKMTPEQLDQLLEQMAEETPEMPADFHAQWVRAVKAEAAKREQNEDRERTGDQEQSRTQEQAGDQTAEDFPAQKKRRLSPAWSRLISAAAVMIFLVGGTLLSRDFLKQEIRIAATARVPEKKAAAVPNTAKDAGQAAGAADEMLIEEAAEAVMEEAGAVNASAAFGSAAMMEDANLAYGIADDQMEEAAEEEMEETITLSASSARKSVTAAEKAEQADSFAGGMMDEPASVMMDMAAPVPTLLYTAPLTEATPEEQKAQAEENAAEAAGTTVFAEMPEAEEDAGGMPQTEAAVSGEDMTEGAGVTTEEISVTEKDSNKEDTESPENPVIGFLKDMWRFVLWIAPWALALGIGAAAGIGWSRRRK